MLKVCQVKSLTLCTRVFVILVAVGAIIKCASMFDSEKRGGESRH